MEQSLKNMDPVLQLIVVMGGLSFLPLMIVTMTSFLRFTVVFSILKTAMGTQQVPPAMVIVGLSLVMTLYTMAPVFDEMYQIGGKEYKATNSMVSAAMKGSKPLKDFMLRQTRQDDVAFFVELATKDMPKTPDDVNFFHVAPAYVMSELKTAFEIGFVIFIPFIVLDIVIANILLALGMFMLSPTIISLPFKLLIFIAVDGWGLIVKGLVNSFN